MSLLSCRLTLRRMGYIRTVKRTIFYRRVSDIMPKRVLIADDSSTVRDIIKFFLSLRGDLEVCREASDGFDAIEKATASKPDVILLDFGMPRMNGAEAARTLKKLMPEIPIILFTMYSENI
jgi:DNA-binding NarL/FixJ family response regulator